LGAERGLGCTARALNLLSFFPYLSDR